MTRFERWRRTTGLFLGPILFVLVLVLPSSLEWRAHRLGAVFALVVVYWISEAIPLAATALLGPSLAVVLGVAGAREAFAPFGDPIIFLFLGSFLIARAMSRHGLDRRIALFVLSRQWVRDRAERVLLAFGAIAAFLSMWMSNTATTAMMLPIGMGVLGTLRPEENGDKGKGGRYATGLMLMIAFSCSLGGIATPVGTPPNLIALGMFERIVGIEVSFVRWMTLGVPVTLACFAFLYLLVRWWVRGATDLRTGAGRMILREREGLGAWRPGEKAALVAFSCAVVLWILPGVVSLALGAEHPVGRALDRSLPEGASAVLAAALLFVLPVDWSKRRFALDWSEAVRIDWGTILLFGGGLSLGSLAFSTGLAGALGEVIVGATRGMPVWALALVAVFIANGMTELMSNTATANLLIPMFLALAAQSQGHTALAALGATVGCSLAFCLPVATPPNAIVYGSGQVPLTQMIRLGVVLDVACGLLGWGVLILLADRLGF